MTPTLFLWVFVILAALSLVLLFFLTRSQQKNPRPASAETSSGDAQLLEKINTLEAEISRLKETKPQVEFVSFVPLTEKVSQALSALDMPSVLENTYEIVPLDDPQIKGRVIGKEGQNIRAFEFATGTELLIDDYPSAVVVSCFSPQRRALAVRCLKVLLQGGKIYPQRIIETVSHAQESQNKDQLNIARTHFKQIQAAQSFSDILLIQFGALHQQVYQGLNLLRYIKEVTLLSGQLATHLGLEAQKAEKYCLRTLAQTHFLNPELPPDFIAPLNTPEKQLFDTLIQLASELSYQRVYKRALNQATFFERQEALEAHCLKLPDVESAHVLRTGKEVRVFVRNTLKDKDKDELRRTLQKHLQRFSSEDSPLKVTLIDALC